jgi:hypothetical protein
MNTETGFYWEMNIEIINDLKNSMQETRRPDTG